MDEREPQLLTITDVARMLQISERHVRNLIASGKLPAPKKVGGKLPRWFPSQIQAYLDRLRDGDG